MFSKSWPAKEIFVFALHEVVQRKEYHMEGTGMSLKLVSFDLKFDPKLAALSCVDHVHLGFCNM